MKQSLGMDAKAETIVVGVPAVGKGYVYSKVGEQWDRVGELSSPTQPYRRGTATVVAISPAGTMAALGDPRGWGTGALDWQGFVSVSTQKSGAWEQVTVIEGRMRYFRRADITRTGRGDAAAATWIFRGDRRCLRYARCGYSLALSGDNSLEHKLAIGCPGQWVSGDRPDYTGPLVKVCVPTNQLDPTDWSCGDIEQDNADKYSKFGRAVALNAAGSQVAVGAPKGGDTWGCCGEVPSAAHVGRVDESSGAPHSQKRRAAALVVAGDPRGLPSPQVSRGLGRGLQHLERQPVFQPGRPTTRVRPLASQQERSEVVGHR